jgi:hypothetical protein
MAVLRHHAKIISKTPKVPLLTGRVDGRDQRT